VTVFGRDASDFDATVSFAGLSFLTHKSTEGTSVAHAQYGPRLNAARAFGVPVLGAYHVLRTPGSGGAGSLAQQLSYWVANLDAHTPWWRTWPHWVMQIDAEKWPYDPVSAATVLAFASLLVRSGLPGWKVTYASHGQFGDSLRGCVTPLWNANYNGSVGGSYPGDNYTGWAAYSGQVPVIAQYTSTPYDHNAFRGTLAELLALTGRTADDMTPEEHTWLKDLHDRSNWSVSPPAAQAQTGGVPLPGSPSAMLAQQLSAPPPTPSIVLTDVQAAAIAAAVATAVATRHEPLSDVDKPAIQAAVLDALRAGTIS